MAKFRKKPVVIEAVQFTAETKDSISDWLNWEHYHGFDGSGAPILQVSTLEGLMTASLGDWIVRGVKGEFYPCKPDIFDATYEPAE